MGSPTKTCARISRRSCGLDSNHLTPGRLTYDLRRPRLHGLIARISHSQRYRQSALPRHTGGAAHRLVLHARLWVHPTARNGAHHPAAAVGDPALRPYFDQVEGAIDRWVDQAKLVAQTRLIRIISDPFRGLRRENIAQ